MHCKGQSTATTRQRQRQNRLKGTTKILQRQNRLTRSREGREGREEKHSKSTAKAKGAREGAKARIAAKKSKGKTIYGPFEGFWGSREGAKARIAAKKSKGKAKAKQEWVGRV